MKTYRCFIKLFVNEHGTPKQPFDHYDLSSPKQCELIIQHGIKLDRDKILEQFAGEIPKSILEIERIISGSEELPHKKIYDLPKYKKEPDEWKPSRWSSDNKKQESEEISIGWLYDNKRYNQRQMENIKILMAGVASFRNKDIHNCETKIYWYLNIESMQEDFEQNDICLTADFVSDFSDYTIVDSLKLVIDESKEALFYEKIFKLLREGEHSTRKIAELVATDELTISHSQVNEMKKLIRLKPFY